MNVHSSQCLQGIIVLFIHIQKKKPHLFPSSAPPQENKYKFPLYTKRQKKKRKKKSILPLPFPTSFQTHENHQFISPLHQPTGRIQLPIFLHLVRLAPPLPLRSWNALFEGQWSGLYLLRLTQKQNPNSFGQINCISLLCSCSISPLDRGNPHSLLSPSRRPAMELRWRRKTPAFEHLTQNGWQAENFK